MFKTLLSDTNYRAKVVKLTEPKPHPNADRLQIFTVDFQDVITDTSYNEGDYVVYFPLECAINKELISYINGYTDCSLNKNKEVKGFFNQYGRVRAVRLRQHPSQGFILQYNILKEFLLEKTGKAAINPNDVFEEFDSFNNITICQKYVPKTNSINSSNVKQSKSVKGFSRLVDGQFRLHCDTEQLRRNISKLNLTDYIGIHKKKHGTSFVVGNILTKRKLKWFEKLLIYFGVNLKVTMYDYVYSSRKVVKNQYETQNKQGYYKSDIWGIVKDEIKDCIPKGYTLYGEILGYTPEGEYIQENFDYGCTQKEHKVYIYRITITNEDGYVIELDDMQIKQFCNKYNLNYADTFVYYGTVNDFIESVYYGGIDDKWREAFIQELETKFTEKDCDMCIYNNVPEEGVVIRNNLLFGYEAFKLKSFRFLEHETKKLDEGKCSIEENQV